MYHLYSDQVLKNERRKTMSTNNKDQEPVPAIDLAALQSLEGRFGWNGRRCDMLNFICSCGAWHKDRKARLLRLFHDNNTHLPRDLQSSVTEDNSTAIQENPLYGHYLEYCLIVDDPPWPGEENKKFILNVPKGMSKQESEELKSRIIQCRE